MLEAHDYGSSDDERAERVAEMMREVLLPDDRSYLAATRTSSPAASSSASAWRWRSPAGRA